MMSDGHSQTEQPRVLSLGTCPGRSLRRHAGRCLRLASGGVTVRIAFAA